MLELKIKTASRYVAPADLVKAIGVTRALEQLGDMVEALIAQIDIIEGEPDLECTGDLEPDDDGKGDHAWIEWHTRGAHKVALHGGELTARDRDGRTLHEDDEDDDTAEEDDPSGQCDEDGINTGLSPFPPGAAGCHISDPDQDGTYCDGAPLPVLSWGIDQSEPLPFDDGADKRVMREYRDRIRAKSYVPVPSPWRGNPPIYAKAAPGNVGNLTPVTPPRLRLVSSS